MVRQRVMCSRQLSVGKILWACSLLRASVCVFVNSPPFSPFEVGADGTNGLIDTGWEGMDDAHRDRTNLLLQFVTKLHFMGSSRGNNLLAQHNLG